MTLVVDRYIDIVNIIEHINDKFFRMIKRKMIEKRNEQIRFVYDTLTASKIFGSCKIIIGIIYFCRFYH